MAFFGPGVTLNTKPRWRQGWWWKEKLPGIIGMSVLAALAVTVAWATFHFTGDDDSDGTAAPQSSRSAADTPRPSPTPTVQPPVFPEKAKEKSLVGVKAFVKYYFDVLNYTQLTNDVTRLQRIQLEECEACQKQIKIFEEVKADNQRFIGGEYKALSVAATPVDENTYSCAADFSTTDASLVDADGNTLETLASEDASNRLVQRVTWSNESWQIVAQGGGRVEGN